VAVRRGLAREPGPQAVADHVTQAFARLGIEPDERTLQKGLRVVGAALGRVEWKEGSFARDIDLIGSMLTDLVRGTEEAEIGSLVAAGERRVERLRKARQGRLWDRLLGGGGGGGGGAGRATPPPAASRDAGPRTIAGHGLKALARYDIPAARALPDDPSPECATAVIDNAFSIAVRERFGERPDPDHIVMLAESVARISQTPPIAASDVESLVLAEFAESTSEPETAAEIKVAAFVKIVDDLGLYGYEIDDLIIMAESIAEEDGCELSLLYVD